MVLFWGLLLRFVFWCCGGFGRMRRDGLISWEKRGVGELEIPYHLSIWESFLFGH
jgi:hypothetical protein